MIRSTPLFVTINLVGAICALVGLTISIVSPSTGALFPNWITGALCLLIFASCAYQIFMRLSGREIPLAWWARGKTDRQIWIVKGVVLTVLAIVALAIIFYPR